MDNEQQNGNGNVTEEVMKDIISSLIMGVEKDFKESYATAIDHMITIYGKGDKKYIDSTNRLFADLMKICAAPFSVKDNNNKYLYQYIVNGQYKQFIKRYVVKYEGHSCCADKASYIEKMTRKALETGENQSLFATYEGNENIKKEDWGEKAYWSPKTIKDTDEAMKLFWDWLLLRD